MENLKSVKTAMLIQSKEEASELYAHFKTFERPLDLSITVQTEQLFSMAVTELIECFILDWNYGPDVIVDLVGRIRKIENYKKTPIVCLTYAKDKNIPLQYSSLNLNWVISRPYIQVEIKKMFAEMLAISQTSIIPESSNVLILDDNPDIIEIMVNYMEEIKHKKFQTCASVAEAKMLVDQHEFDLFLLDWNLGDGTCLDLIKFVRSKKDNIRLTNALIMVVTGRNDIDDTFTLLKHNVTDQLIKPFDYNEFEEKLSYAILRHSKKAKSA